MEERVVTLAERVYSSYVNDIEHIESQSLNGLSIIKVYFQPDGNLEAGIAQIAAASQAVTHNMPPGITPPFMLRFNATDVAVLQLSLGSPKRTEAELNDYATNFVRIPLATVHGATVPPAYGGVPLAVDVDIDPQALYAKGLSPQDVEQRARRGKCDRAGRHGADGWPRVLRAPQLHARFAEGPGQPADQAGERSDRISPGRRAGPSRCGRADEHRAPGWTPRHVPLGAEERQGLDTGHREPREGDDPAAQGADAGGRHPDGHGRPVRVCPRHHCGCPAGRNPRGTSGQP